MASITQNISTLFFFICISFPCISSTAFNYSAVFNFGDSNSDTGGFVAGYGVTLFPPNGQTYFKKPSGRFCDGRLIIDFLLDAFGLPYLNPYLDSVGAPSFKTGCNFAAGESTILTPLSRSPFSSRVQVYQFRRLRDTVLDLQAQGNRELDDYIPSVDVLQKGLYTIDLGQNDLASAFNSNTSDQVIALIPSISERFGYFISDLYDQGARNFWIHNTGPLGCLPQNIAEFGTDPSKLDELGCVATHNQAAKLLNQQIYDVFKKKQANYTDASFTHIDIFSIKSDLIANYSQYGFEQPKMACCENCGQTKAGNGGASVPAQACSDSTKYVNWDGIHYTEAANQFVASQILTGKYSDPPFENQVPAKKSQK